MQVRIDAAAFDPGRELSAFSRSVSGAGAGAGAVVTFTGLVRDDDGDLVALEIEHYPAMTAASIEVMVAEATQRWSLTDALVIHRHGRLLAGEPIMMVATAAAHRAAAFEAADSLMDYLKSRAPFWKKEITARGEAWVSAKVADEDALKRW